MKTDALTRLATTKTLKLDFVGVGPGRSGTSWLHANFATHPQVALPKAPIKEVYFFDENYQRGFGWYQKHFAESDALVDKCIGEFGPSYFDVAEAPERIQAHNPNCKIIISVRDPVERAFSVFLHLARLGRVAQTFDEAVKQEPRIVTKGHYKQHVQHWLNYFPLEQMHFVLLDDIKQQPLPTLNQFCDFLGVSGFMANQIMAEAVNAAYVSKLPLMQPLNRLKQSLSRAARKNHNYGLLSLGHKANNLVNRWFVSDMPREQYPQLSAEKKQLLYELYAEDITFIEQLLQKSLNVPGLNSQK